MRILPLLVTATLALLPPLAAAAPNATQPSAPPGPSASTSASTSAATSPSSDIQQAFAQLRQQKEMLDQQLQQLRGQIESDQDQIRQSSGRSEVSPPRLHETLGGLDDQIQSLSVDIQSTTARMEAIENAAAEIRTQANQSAHTDAVVDLLNQVVDARQKAVARTKDMFAKGVAPETDVMQADAALAEAKAQVAIQQEKVIAASGGDTITALNKELVDLRINQEENKSKLKILQDQRAGLDHVRHEINDLEQRSAESLRFESELSTTATEFDKARAQLNH